MYTHANFAADYPGPRDCLPIDLVIAAGRATVCKCCGWSGKASEAELPAWASLPPPPQSEPAILGKPPKQRAPAVDPNVGLLRIDWLGGTKVYGALPSVNFLKRKAKELRRTFKAGIVECKSRITGHRYFSRAYVCVSCSKGGASVISLMTSRKGRGYVVFHDGLPAVHYWDAATGALVPELYRELGEPWSPRDSMPPRRERLGSGTDSVMSRHETILSERVSHAKKNIRYCYQSSLVNGAFQFSSAAETEVDAGYCLDAPERIPVGGTSTYISESYAERGQDGHP